MAIKPHRLPGCRVGRQNVRMWQMDAGKIVIAVKTDDPQMIMRHIYNYMRLYYLGQHV